MLGILTSIVILMLDLKVKLGISLGTLYILPMFFFTNARNWTTNIVFYAVSLSLITVGWLISPGDSDHQVMMDRMISYFSVTLILVIVGYYEYFFQVQQNDPNLLSTSFSNKVVIEETQEHSVFRDTISEIERLGILSHFVRKAGDGIVISNEDGTILEANEVFSEKLGYMPQELIESNLHQLMEDPKKHKSFYDDFLTEEGTVKFRTVEGRHRTGISVPFSLGASKGVFKGRRYGFAIARFDQDELGKETKNNERNDSIISDKHKRET